MSLISNLVPVNLESEKQKFFASGGKVNPRFHYHKVYAASVLHKYGLPRVDYIEKAQEYVRQHRFQKPAVTGEVLSLAQMEAILEDLCKRLGIEPIHLQTDARQNSRFMIVRQNVLSVQWPAKVTREQFDDVLNHEIQTHLLRRLNERKQPWYRDKTRRNVLWKMTEEGLATYNSKDKDNPDLWQAAWLYLLVAWAQTEDFVSVYQRNLEYGLSRERAFTNTLRVKRGVRDTSQPGGFTKDLVYWEGYWRVAEYLADPKHDIRDLYWGKVGLDELEELRSRAVTKGLVYPTFIGEK